jgi:hypothetical protein
VTKAGGGNFVANFQNTTAATPYGVQIKDAASSANGYPVFQVTNSTGSTAHLKVMSGTGDVLTAGSVGIGTSSPSSWAKLTIAGTGGAQTGATQALNVTSPSATANEGVGIRLSAASGSNEAVGIIGMVNNASGNYGSMTFHTYSGGSYITERMRIDSAGRVTKPYQPAATAGWTAHISAPTTLPANNILTNVGSHLAANGRFTCPIAGVYHVGVAYMSLASGNTRVHLRKNGSEYGAGTMVAYQNHSSSYGAASAQGYIYCSANDYLEWYLDATYVALHSGHGQINFALFS